MNTRDLRVKAISLEENDYDNMSINSFPEKDYYVEGYYFYGVRPYDDSLTENHYIIDSNSTFHVIDRNTLEKLN